MITNEERKKYVLKTPQDERILEKIHELERRVLTREETELVEFCKSQLEGDWRTPLENFINRLLQKRA